MAPPRASSLLLAGLAAALSCTDERTNPLVPKFGEATAEELVGAMTLDEKIAEMHGTGAVDELFETAPNERLGIPGLKMVDGPRGVRAGHATAFPVAAARGATFDVELERRVGEAIGVEASAKGANMILAPTMNVLRHPAWGRAQETYGEDPTHVGAMAVAFIEGAQTHVLASAKHFAVNSIEDTRFDVDVTIDERTLREVYLPHFRRAVVDGHVASVMSAYNAVNGAPMSESAHLLRDILKGEWGFDGFVESDWVFGTRSTAGAAIGGLDIEMPTPVYFGGALSDAVLAGAVPESIIDEAATRVVRKKLAFADKLRPTVDATKVESPEHLALARDVAVESMVLLVNDGALPIARAPGTLVVVGPLAKVANLGDLGSSAVTPSSAITPLQGIEAVAAPLGVVHVEGPTFSTAELETLASASAVVVVAGLTSDEEGEGLITKGGDRETLSLPPAQEKMILDVAAVAKQTIVVVEAGSAIVVRPWVDQVSALLMAWYPGMQGGAAIADVLFGDASPGGRLPASFPRAEADLVSFDHSSLEVTYGFLHGYRWLDDQDTEPEFPFGFGLSYTTFAMSGLAVTRGAEGVIEVGVDVTNTGPRDGDEVVQVYVGAPAGSAVPRAPRDLRAFTRVHLAAGETRRASLTVREEDLAYFDVATSTWIVEPGSYAFSVGSSSRALPLAVSSMLP